MYTFNRYSLTSFPPGLPFVLDLWTLIVVITAAILILPFVSLTYILSIRIHYTYTLYIYDLLTCSINLSSAYVIRCGFRLLHSLSAPELPFILIPYIHINKTYTYMYIYMYTFFVFMSSLRSGSPPSVPAFTWCGQRAR